MRAAYLGPVTEVQKAEIKHGEQVHREKNEARIAGGSGGGENREGVRVIRF